VLRATGQIVSGAISDLWSRRKTLMMGAALFIAGSLISGFAPSVGFFLAGRGVQGLGFAFIHPVAMAQ
jgi:MFS family permease